MTQGFGACECIYIYIYIYVYTYMHTYIHTYIHRDLKPANVLVCSNTNKMKLIDFGAAAAMGTQDQVCGLKLLVYEALSY